MQTLAHFMPATTLLALAVASEGYQNHSPLNAHKRVGKCFRLVLLRQI
jgi:hypothetical protein